ncbi:3-oxoadipyl-CoA thiolase [soil metagenome]
MTEAFICDAIRTPIGRLNGGLAGVRPDDLGAVPIKALMARNTGVDPARVDDVIYGGANQSGEDNRDVARMSLLLAGLPSSVPGVTVNRLCASGLEAVGQAARAIRTDQADLIIAGGVESMTRAPYVMGKAGSAFDRSAKLEDTTLGWRLINPKMKALYGVDTMPETAENVAQAHQVTREDQDRYAEQTQQRAGRAQANGFFAAEITPVERTDAKGKPLDPFTTDEHPRPETTLEMLSKLKPVVRPDGCVTAGNASGLNDGAAAMFVASEAAASAHGLKPRARILGMAAAGVEPKFMGMGPAPASQKLMARLGLTISDFDVIEVNEAFAAQVIASMRALGVAQDEERLNPNGGAIALGHPLGMSGARLAMTAVHALEVTGGKRALVTLCIGVGQGLAVALERV